MPTAAQQLKMPTAAQQLEMTTNQPKFLDLLKHINKMIKQITFSEEDKEVWQIFKDSTECNELKIKTLKLYAITIWTTAFMISPDEFKNLIELFTRLFSKKIGDSNIEEVKELGELGGGRRKGLRRKGSRRKGSRRKRSRRKRSRRKGSRRKGSRSLTGGSTNAEWWAKTTFWLFLIPKIILFATLFLEARDNVDGTMIRTLDNVEADITQIKEMVTTRLDPQALEALYGLQGKLVQMFQNRELTGPFEKASLATLKDIGNNGFWNLLYSSFIALMALGVFGQPQTEVRKSAFDNFTNSAQNSASSAVESLTGRRNLATGGTKMQSLF
jgi:hypothetical protein